MNGLLQSFNPAVAHQQLLILTIHWLDRCHGRSRTEPLRLVIAVDWADDFDEAKFRHYYLRILSGTHPRRRIRTRTNGAGTNDLLYLQQSRRSCSDTGVRRHIPLSTFTTNMDKTLRRAPSAAATGPAVRWPTTTPAADATKWIYQEATGLWTQKQDATLKGAV